MNAFSDYYWVVGGSTTQVYSSAGNVYVPLTDPLYEAWLVANPGPRSILNEAELWVVLNQRLSPPPLPWLFDGTTFVQPAVGAHTPAQLVAYAAGARYAAETRGITAGGVAVPTDRQTQAQLTGAYTYAQVTPGATIQWKLADGTFVPLSAVQIAAAAAAVASHVQACFAAEATVRAGALALTITSLAQVDAAFSGI